MATGDRCVEEEEAVEGGTAAEGARGPLHASSLPFGNAGRAIARKLGFTTALTFALLVQALQGWNRAAAKAELWTGASQRAKSPSRGVPEQEYFCQSFRANMPLWAGTQSCHCPLGGDPQS